MSSPVTPAASIPLPVEIILNIVEHLCWQPGDIGRLLRSSKIINNILRTHEAQLSRSFTSHLYPASPLRPILASLAPEQEPILSSPSSSPPHHRHKHTTPPLRFPHTFPWVTEIHTRHHLLANLPTTYLLDLTHPSLHHLFSPPSPTLCKTCHHRGLAAFKTHGLHTLYSLSDARICGFRSPSPACSVVDADGRSAQEFWVAQQDALELASALAVVWAASCLFDYGPKAGWGGENGCEHEGHGEGSEAEAAGSGAVDYELVERQCIYRELALTHGPWFLGASVGGSEVERGTVKGMLDEGVVGLKEYEMGEVQGGRQGGSLQSVLLRRFCRLREVSVREGWDEVFDVIGEEVQKYRDVHGQ